MEYYQQQNPQYSLFIFHNKIFECQYYQFILTFYHFKYKKLQIHSSRFHKYIHRTLFRGSIRNQKAKKLYIKIVFYSNESL